MAVKQKHLRNLVEAVSAILGDEQKAKKLKKTKALERFINKLEDKHREMEKQLAKSSSNGKARKEKARQADSLEKQIKKAKKLLEDMK